MLSRPNEKLSLGPSASWTSYQKDLSGYTLGQGGYYSPGTNLSAGLSLTWLRRLPDWSWRLETGVAGPWTRNRGSDRYPLKGLLPPDTPDLRSRSGGSTSLEAGWHLKAALERRLGDRLVLGLAAEARKSPDYSPVEGTLYLRYTFGDSLLDLPMGPEAPVPFAEW